MKRTLILTIITAAWLFGCSDQNDHWVKSPGVDVSVEKDYDHGKPYLTVFYSNFGVDTIKKIRYQLISETNGHFDTTIKTIDLLTLLRPNVRHVLPREIGQDTLAADEVSVGKVWVVKAKR